MTCLQGQRDEGYSLSLPCCLVFCLAARFLFFCLLVVLIFCLAARFLFFCLLVILMFGAGAWFLFSALRLGSYFSAFLWFLFLVLGFLSLWDIKKKGKTTLFALS